MSRKTRPPLTKTRQAWAASRGGATFRGQPLNYNAAVEARYRDSLSQMVRRMQQETLATMRKLEAIGATDATVAMDVSLASQARILTNALRAKFQAAFNRQAQGLAERFARETEAASRGSLHASLKELSGGISLKTSVLPPPVREAVKAGITENVNLIRSIPEQYFQRLQGSVMRNIQRGDGTAGILRTVEALGLVTENRAALIARDQTSKATTALNAARMRALNVRKFEWLHSGGGKEPRKLHEDMSGNVYDLDDPPVIDDKTGERGLPGQLINCRCRMVPVVDYGEPDE